MNTILLSIYELLDFTKNLHNIYSDIIVNVKIEILTDFLLFYFNLYLVWSMNIAVSSFVYVYLHVFICIEGLLWSWISKNVFIPTILDLVGPFDK